MNFKSFGIAAAVLIVFVVMVVVGQRTAGPRAAGTNNANDRVFNGQKIVRSEDAWKRILTPEAFVILRQKGTERAYTGKLTANKKRGVYSCAACGLHLFSSEHKFDSGTGWPSFYQVINKANVSEEVDKTLENETRIEVLCARCDSHLGHVFDDGPPPTGLRYCINSVALKFVPTP